MDEKKSIEKNAIIVGSIPFIEQKKYYNRLFVVKNGEIITYYNKKHLFTYGEENKYFNAGNKQVYLEIDGWKLALSICYDLRFPVWLRNTQDYDILINIANWPASRIKTWKTLLKARAIENMCYTIGVNRTGTDGYNIDYNGKSAIINPTGYKLQAKNKQPYTKQYTISKENILNLRETYKFLNDRDNFELKNT